MSHSTAGQTRPRSLYYQRKMGTRKEVAPASEQSAQSFGTDVIVAAEPTHPESGTASSVFVEKQPDQKSPDQNSSHLLETDPEPAIIEPSIVFPTADDSPLGLHMQSVEPEKMEWMKDMNEPVKIIEGTVPEKGKLFEARFDPEGTVLSPDSKIPVSSGLYHHGQDPEKPGYTLDEILILLQSSSQSQKLWALAALTAIFRKAKASIYDRYLDESLLQRISDEGMVLPLRYLLDSPNLPVVTASLLAFRALLVNEADEFLTDELLIWENEPLLFELVPETATSDKETDEKDLPDAQLIKIDVVKGLLRTSILQRFSYLLRTYLSEMDGAVLNCLFSILIRIIRHSGEIAQQVADESELMQHLISQIVSVKAPLGQMRFLRILTWILGPVPGKWTERIYNSAAGWISALRTDITNITTRDMVTESLNLLIIIANYGQITLNSLSIVDVFPRVLYSAGPIKTGAVATVWDARCCSQMLMLLTLCLRIEFNGHYVLDDVLVEKITQNVMDAYILLKGSDIPKSDSDKQKYMLLLESSYWLYLTEYIRQKRQMSRNISRTLPDKILESLPNILNFSRILNREEFKASPADPDCLQSYRILEYGGNSFNPFFRQGELLSYAENALKCLSVCSEGKKLSPAEMVLINSSLIQIPLYSQKTDDFWSYHYVKPLLETVLFAHMLLTGGNAVDREKLYSAALHLVPFLLPKQQEQLKVLLTEIIFSMDLYRDTSWFNTAPVLTDMSSVRLAFSDLRPLGFPDKHETTSLIVPTRDAHVFSKYWMLECYPYLRSWIAQQSIVHKISKESFIRGYFAWIVVIVHAFVGSESRNFSLRDVYLALASFFTAEDDVYRDVFVGTCLQTVLQVLVASAVPKGLNLKSGSKVQGKALDDCFGNLLDEYLASSYGDRTFTNYILVYLTQSGDIAFRKKFWGPEKQAWSAVRLHPKELCYPITHHLDPLEKDITLLNQYLRLLINREVTKERHPLMFLIAVHHINHFLRNPVNLDEDALKFHSGTLNVLSRMKNDEVAQQILRYLGPAPDSDAVLTASETVPTDVIKMLQSI